MSAELPSTEQIFTKTSRLVPLTRSLFEALSSVKVKGGFNHAVATRFRSSDNLHRPFLLL